MVPAQESSRRTVVQVSVPDWQKAEWEEHAIELDMSLSEFVRSMVQAGRNGFNRTQEPPQSETYADSGETTDQLYAYIEAHQPASWDDIVTALTSDIEREADDTLHELQASGRIRYSGPQDGYITPE